MREKDFPGVIGDYDKEVSEWVVETCFFVYEHGGLGTV